MSLYRFTIFLSIWQSSHPNSERKPNKTRQFLQLGYGNNGEIVDLANFFGFIPLFIGGNKKKAYQVKGNLLPKLLPLGHTLVRINSIAYTFTVAPI